VGLVALLILGGCHDKGAAREGPGGAQGDAEQLGREVAEIVDRVMAYKTSHRGTLPTSLRQAGIDSLAPQFVRRLDREGDAPLVTIVFRRLEGHQLSSCQGTNEVLEDKMLRGGAFDVSCTLIAGGVQGFTVPPPPPPPKPK
jgi:hypothetical protein